MGLFTMYCPLCGGPIGQIDPQSFNLKFSGEFSWLGDCLALTAINEVLYNNGVGEIDYGVMETSFGNVSGMRCHWKRLKKFKTSSGKVQPWEVGEDRHEDIPGVIMHRFCFKNFVAPLGISPKKLFKCLGDMCVNDYSNMLHGLDYGDILRNQGQFYECVSGEAHLVMSPIPLFVVKCHADSVPNPPPGFFFQLGREVLLHCILRWLFDDLDLFSFGRTCKASNLFCRHVSLWKNRASRLHFGLFDENTLVYRAFCSKKSLRNYLRIASLSDQLVNRLKQNREKKQQGAASNRKRK